MKVLVVYKKSFLESHGDRRTVAHLDAASRARFVKSDVENRRAVADVAAHLERLGVRYDAVFRGSLAARRRYDLVVSLGGDGTFFAAARYVNNHTPILGINSDPSSSLGLWTCADRDNFQGPLEAALAGRLPAVTLNRMAVVINGKEIPQRPFNDVLFAHRNPAAMTRYRLSVNGRLEDQKSSGLWVATAAGSTAAIRSAGGRRMPVTSRLLQYLVREPYTWPQRRYRLVRGTAAEVAVTTYMMESGIWLDGSRVRYDLRLGDRVQLRAGEPLRVLGYDDRRRRLLFP
jgi:NAD+ kinase